MYVLCDVQDGNYILVDASQQKNGRYPIVDGYQEMFPNPDYCKQIVGFFCEFLAGALRSNGRQSWLKQYKK
jgi:hypothetical protein